MKYRTGLFLAALLCCRVGIAADAPADDRTVVPLSSEHRAIVLHEMRQLLTGVQRITAALAQQDMDAVIAAASSLGIVMSHQIPPDLKQALPLEFRQQGLAVHRAFDQIALDAASMQDSRHVLQQFSETLSQCVACHAVYQIRATD
jgi:hypothetical protein